MNTCRINVLLISIIISFVSLYARNEKGSILVLPFDANGIDPVYVQTASSILKVELEKQGNVYVIPDSKVSEILDGNECYSTECAISIGKKAGAGKVAGCKLAALGEKIIAQYFLVDADAGKTLLVDQLSAVNLEDLEPVMKRIASNIIQGKPSEENAQVGNIVQEETNKPLRRASRKNIGLSFGYLFPQEGYENDEKSFTLNLHLDYELEDLAVGLLAGARDGFAMNVYGEYLFTTTDICPYAGGAFGFHWVSHPARSYVTYNVNSAAQSYEDKKGDGFELTFSTGLRILHTYNFQIMLNLEYIMTFNDFDDKAIVFTIGIL